MIDPDASRWSPFRVADSGAKGDQPRSIDSVEGIGDRLRVAAFAEIQARDAFRWAAGQFHDASPTLRRAWRALADAEQRHLDWLLERMTELRVAVEERRVSEQLWRSFQACKTAGEFANYMASAEERGRLAGERFHAALERRDPASAGIFKKIAIEEAAHIELARRYFPAGAC